MRFIIDTNRIISSLIKDGWTREIITSPTFEFFTIDFVLEELRKYQPYIIKKAQMTKKEFDLLFELVLENINIISDKAIKEHMKRAIDIMKDIDINDSPIVACALSIQNDGIWTEDKDFIKQHEIKIWTTQQLKEILNTHR